MTVAWQGAHWQRRTRAGNGGCLCPCHARHGCPPAHWLALVGGTDGRDGPPDAAGAIITSDDAFDAEAASAALAAHDAYHYLDARNQLVKVPPTGTILEILPFFWPQVLSATVVTERRKQGEIDENMI